MFAKKPALYVFLEKDNVKLVVASVSGGKATRVYAGQVNFPADVLREAFIADASRFAAQVKIALSQKQQLQEAQVVYLIMPPEKTFMKTLEPSESVDSFIHNLPFFKEELLIQSYPTALGKEVLQTQVAFEKRSIADLEQPFLDAGKKIEGIFGSAPALALQYGDLSDLLFLLVLEKTIASVVVRQGRIQRVDSWDPETFAGRFIEFIHGQKLEEVKTVKYVGKLPDKAKQDLATGLGLECTPVASEDVYDLTIASLSSKAKATGKAGKTGMPTLSWPKNLSLLRHLPLLGAMVVGFVLGWIVLSALTGSRGVLPRTTLIPIATPPTPVPPPAGNPPPPAPTLPTPAPAVKKADLKISVLNGTTIPGEAGRVATKVTALGYKVSGTGNAEKQTYTTTLLSVNKKFSPESVSELKALLEGIYKTVEVSSDYTGTTADGEIIIGTKK